MAAAIFVVVFRLGDRIVYVDGGNFQCASFEHFDQAMNARGGFFSHTVDVIQHVGVLFMHHAGQITAVVQQHGGVPWLTVF